ncbi:hypothetical protein M3Y95_00015900 [Aphelenchoides besseyi]|nr:hypothetical protein M3Y95_00015900 [Aphelenchoides besseyi]
MLYNCVHETRSNYICTIYKFTSFWKTGTSTHRHQLSCNLRDTSLSIVLLCFIVFLLCTEPVDAKAHAKPRVYVVKSRNSPMVIKKCRFKNRLLYYLRVLPCASCAPENIVYNNPALHMIMDRVCLLCHEMFSHDRPNMRSECRSNCFKSEHFRKCLDVFAPQNSGQILKQLD